MSDFEKSFETSYGSTFLGGWLPQTEKIQLNDAEFWPDLGR